MTLRHGQAQNKVSNKRILTVLIITACYLFAEVIGGFLSNSLALLADAGHMLTDVAALSISLFATKLSMRAPNKKASFGYYRAEVLAALFNGLILLLVAIFLIKESVFRLMQPATDVKSGIMMFIALGGLLVNLFGLKLLYQHKGANLNIKSAWLHLLFDAMGSVAVLVSGIFIHFYGWRFADPIASMVIAVMVLYSAIYLIAQTIDVLMEHAPAHIDVEALTLAIKSIPEVLDIHDLHIWSLSPGKETLSAHVIIRPNADYERIQKAIHELLDERFAIEHVTIQLERNCTYPDSICKQP